MRTILSILFSLICFVGFAQKPIVTNRSTPSSFVIDSRWGAGLNMKAPVYDDTTAASTVYALGLDSAGSIIFTRDSSFLWVRHTGKYWQKVGFGSVNSDTIFFETPLRVVDNVVYIDPVSEVDSGYVTPAMFIKWNQKVDSVSVFEDTIYYFINEERNLAGVVSGFVDSVKQRWDTLRYFVNGDSTLIGTVSGGGGRTLQEDFDAAPTANPSIAITDGNSLFFWDQGNGGIYLQNDFSGPESSYINMIDGRVTINSTNSGNSTGVSVAPEKITLLNSSDTTTTKVGIGTEYPTAPLHVVGAPRFATDSAAAGYVWTAKDNTGQGEWRASVGGGSGVTTAQLTDSLNAREPRYKFRDDSTGNAGYTTLYQNGLKANTASPTFTGTVTTPMLQVTGRTSLQGVAINKDSLPITTTNRWAVTVDTPTNRLQRYDLERKADTFNQVFTGSISLSSTTGGIGLPPMTQTQMNAISSPAPGVQVWDTTYDAVCTYTSDFGWWSNDAAWQRANGFNYHEEFLINTTSSIGLIFGNFAGQQNNSSALSNVVATSNRPGIVQLSTQSSATGRPVLVLDAVASRSNIVGGGKIIYETQVQIPTLSSASETFNFFTGLSSSTANVSTNAIAFLYDSAGTNAGSSAIGRWQVVCSNGSSRSYTTSNVQVTAGQWYSLRAVINAAGTQVDFFIDGTPIKSETNNIPTGGLSYTYTLTKTNGTTARTALVDYFFMRQKFTTTR